MKAAKTILVVEDEEAQREALRDRLEKAGYVVLLAKNGEEGLQAALLNRPDLVLMDINMPRMDGIEMVTKLRADEWGAKVPVIIMTNIGDTESVQKALEAGVYEYFVKSDMTLEHLTERIDALLAKGR